MTASSTILVPTDFSEGSAAALQCACQLADALHAELRILHVVEDPYPLGAYTEYYSPPPEAFLVRQESHARSQLESLLTPEQRERYHATLDLRQGNAARQILEYLSEHAVYLVVMATHGRGGVARLMMGSVADKIVRMAPCPVLTVRAPHAHEPGTSRAA